MRLVVSLKFALWVFLLTISVPQVNAEGLEIRYGVGNSPYISYIGVPVLSFGPSPQNILTYLPYGNGNDIIDWSQWASSFGINHVRSYPPSGRVPSTAQDVFLMSDLNNKKFDLNLFNQLYFDELRKACLLLKEKGFIVHLQLWQAIYWKKNWDSCYYNPKNNINPNISMNAGPNEFVSMENPLLLAHQKKYVEKILDATGDLGNVFYDIMNEIGNGTGVSEQWVLEIIKSINRWEKDNNTDVLLTLNDEGGMRMGLFSLGCDKLDLIVKDLGRYDEHMQSKRDFSKPTISVRNIDYNYETKRRLYFHGRNHLEINQNAEFQARGRKYWWRMFMAGVQSAGGYADAVSIEFPIWKKIINKLSQILFSSHFYSPEKHASYRLNDLSEANFSHFRTFISKIKDYEQLIPDTTVQFDHPAPHIYCLQSINQAIFYLESPNGNAGFHYKAYRALIKGVLLKDGKYKAIFYDPANGQSQPFQVEINNGVGVVDVPGFFDDLAIYISSS